MVGDKIQVKSQMKKPDHQIKGTDFARQRIPIFKW